MPNQEFRENDGYFGHLRCIEMEKLTQDFMEKHLGEDDQNQKCKCEFWAGFPEDWKFQQETGHHPGCSVVGGRCDFCLKPFTETNDKFVDDKHRVTMHINCYNQWCDENPFTGDNSLPTREDLQKVEMSERLKTKDCKIFNQCPDCLVAFPALVFEVRQNGVLLNYRCPNCEQTFDRSGEQLQVVLIPRSDIIFEMVCECSHIGSVHKYHINECSECECLRMSPKTITGELKNILTGLDVALAKGKE